MSKIKYECKGIKSDILSPPENLKVKCSGSSTIVFPGSKCTVECDTGSPNHDEIECKDKGWRPSNELVCEGVGPGVIIGVMIGVLAVIILLGYIYAKFKQKRKKKLGLSKKVQIGKISQNQRRPGQVDATQNGMETRPNSNGGSSSVRQQEASSQPPKRNNKSSLPSYDEAKDISTFSNRPTTHKPPSRKVASEEMHSKRGNSSRQNAPSQQQGYHSSYPLNYQQNFNASSTDQARHKNGRHHNHGRTKRGHTYTEQERHGGHNLSNFHPPSRGHNKSYYVPT